MQPKGSEREGLLLSGIGQTAASRQSFQHFKKNLKEFKNITKIKASACQNFEQNSMPHGRILLRDADTQLPNSLIHRNGTLLAAAAAVQAS